MIRIRRVASATIVTLMSATGCSVSKIEKQQQKKKQKSANWVNVNMIENTKAVMGKVGYDNHSRVRWPLMFYNN